MANYNSQYTGAQIDAGIAAANAALPRSGGSMTGALFLSGNPSSDNGAATKKYVDDAISEIELMQGEKGEDGYSPTATVAKVGNTATITITDKNGTTTAIISDGEGGGGGSGGGGDMYKSTYDSNESGIVDNSERLGGQLPAAFASANHSHAKADIGLGNVDNVQQYSASNPPPYPVISVDGKTGAVSTGITYSTEETLTGDTWIDGKPIYRRVFFRAAQVSKSSSATLGTISNLETLISLTGSFTHNDGRPFYTFPAVLSSSGAIIGSVRVDGSDQVVYTNHQTSQAHKNILVLVLYTKE